MEKFNYQARNHSGSIISGSQEASSRKELADSLFAKDLTPISIESVTAGKPLGKALSLLPMGRVSLKERVLFSRQFATMISAGIPIVRSLNVLKDQTSSKPLQTALTQIAKQVESGSTLAEALGRFPRIFNPVYVSMVHAGEIGGMLDNVLERLADQMEKDSELTSKVRGAMVYPTLIFFVMTAAFIFIMVVVVPQLKAVFDQVNTELPWNTKLLLSMADTMTKYGIYVGVAIVAVVFFLIRLIHSNQSARHTWHALLLHIPILGTVLRKINLARFARTLGALLGAGIPVLEALKVVTSSLGNVILQDELTKASTAVKNGASLAKTLHASKEFPPIVSEMIAIGEETGELEKILSKLAEFYDKEVTAVVANISSIIEPLMLMVMGTLVGFIIVSVIGPLYQLTNSF